jgi:hypothetical protein
MMTTCTIHHFGKPDGKSEFVDCPEHGPQSACVPSGRRWIAMGGDQIQADFCAPCVCARPVCPVCFVVVQGADPKRHAIRSIKVAATSRHKCDDRCQAAKGPACACECNGAKHGIKR